MKGLKVTIIAWDGNSLSADKRIDFGCSVSTVTKIRKIENKLCGISGHGILIESFFNWVENGCSSENWPEEIKNSESFNGLIIEINNGEIKIKKYEKYCPLPIIIEDEIFAIGSGRDYALAAMWLGRSSIEAVDVACFFDPYCGNGFDTIYFDKED